MGRGHPVGEEAEDPPGAVQPDPVAGGLEGGQHRLDPVHVGVHPAIGGERRPVLGEFVPEQAAGVVPVAGLDHLGDVGEQAVGIGVPGVPGAGGGEQHEDMAIGQLHPVPRPAAADRPQVAAMPGVAVVRPQEGHAGIDDPVGAAIAEGLAHRVGMHEAGGGVQFLRGVGQGRAVPGQHVEAAVPAQAGAEEVELPAGIRGEECPVDGIVQPAAGSGFGSDGLAVWHGGPPRRRALRRGGRCPLCSCCR